MNAERIITDPDTRCFTACAVTMPRARRVARYLAMNQAPAAHERLRGRIRSHPEMTTANAEGTEQ
jgi:hypothetical protein